ncbi:MAG TPA: LytTR family DNA-binding domain-containing protein [Cryomorphaceae bacterium]|nr:LytTR family DNA-binding domain-containing protein [Cryomorphaceae bacterium]
MKIAILDDEKHAAETLQWQLDRHEASSEPIKVYTEVYKALGEIKASPPDVIFLDIEMPGLNGFQFLEELQKPEVKVVFTTAYDRFAIRAFKVNAIDYLLKPIEDEAVVAALERLKSRTNSNTPELIREAFATIEKEKNKNCKIALPSAQGLDFIKCEEIIYCQSESNYTRISLTGGRKILVSKTLKEIGNMLPDSNFLRTHNSYIVNTDRIEKFIKANGGMLQMENKDEVKISRNRKSEILDRLAP